MKKKFWVVFFKTITLKKNISIVGGKLFLSLFIYFIDLNWLAACDISRRFDISNVRLLWRKLLDIRYSCSLFIFIYIISQSQLFNFSIFRRNLSANGRANDQQLAGIAAFISLVNPLLLLLLFFQKTIVNSWVCIASRYTSNRIQLRQSITSSSLAGYFFVNFTFFLENCKPFYVLCAVICCIGSQF